ncbi:MAG: AbrB/MazE/SpoVT family DNA-binding domain-containing protein [Spirochaetales bacterium]|nr:AbrB/MazE/SpoVT family DNA-binding domain-containing protein [Spirochaetales bacterium]
MGKTAKVTSKGQVTIPKEIRDILDSEVVEFEVENERVVLRPVKRVAGKLGSYGNTERIQEESSVWRNAARDTREDR